MKITWLAGNGRKLITDQLYQTTFRQNLKSTYLNKRFLSTTNKLFMAHDPLPPLDPKKYGGVGQTYLDPDYRLRPPPPKSIEDFANPDKTGHWVSFGFDEVDKKLDRHWSRVTMFSIFAVFLPILTFYLYYEPDCIRNKEWVCREAYLELHRREKHGLPYVDPDYIPRDQMILPSEDEIKIDVHY